MNHNQERKLAMELEEDGRNRDYSRFEYTNEALNDVTWPDSNHRISAVLAGKLNYDSLPVDEGNEAAKGMAWAGQQDVIVRNQNSQPLCEVLDMKPCLKQKCILYVANITPPVCREFKMAFPKKG